jgi:hypothetical protein
VSVLNLHDDEGRENGREGREGGRGGRGGRGVRVGGRARARQAARQAGDE